MDEKRRVVPVTEPLPYSYQVPNGVPISYIAPPALFTQVTRTRGHAWPSAGRGKTDVGGDFSTSRVLSMTSSDTSQRDATAYGYRYQGGEFAISPATAIYDAMRLITPPSELSLIQLGTTAIARSLPTNPVADAGTFIGELKAGLPRLVGRELFKTKFKDYRKYGSEYLNVEFGWKPLVSDLQKFGKATIESEKILKQLHRDSGRNIRRRYTFPEERVDTVTNGSGRLSTMVSGAAGYPYLHKSVNGSTMRTETSVSTKTWFSGCFTYHVNLGQTLPDRISRNAAEARKLFGLELTPEVVWNLAPWSWAVDWEGNVGDVLHNVSRFAQDGLVMRHGYIMQEKTCKITYTLDHRGRFIGAPASGLSLTITSQRKERRRATPFGFGFDMTALSGRQSAILGALGISRGPRHL